MLISDLLSSSTSCRSLIERTLPHDSIVGIPIDSFCTFFLRSLESHTVQKGQLWSWSIVGNVRNETWQLRCRPGQLVLASCYVRIGFQTIWPHLATAEVMKGRTSVGLNAGMANSTAPPGAASLR